MSEDGTQAKPAVDIVIFTVNQHETTAVNEAFAHSRPAIPIGLRSYYDLGQFGGARVLHAITQMGDQSTSSAAREAIKTFSPKLLMCVGVAWGAKPDKWKIGDVLLATKLHDWAHRKESSEDGTIPRGFTIPPRDHLLQLAKTAFRDWRPEPSDSKPELHDGLLLSNPVLCDDETERDKALKAHPESVGGEMEGRGLVWEANEARTDWIVIKSICDWGAHKNDVRANKEESQKLAAANSGRFVRYLVERHLGPVLSGTVSLGAPANHDRSQALVNELNASFGMCRFDRNGVARRRSLRLLLLRLKAVPSGEFGPTELEARIWRELARNARTLQERQEAWANSLDAVERLLACKEEREPTSYSMLAEWSIDFSQAHIPGVPFNKMLHQLNKARASISRRLNPLGQTLAGPELGSLYSLRSKCHRATAELLKRRGQNARAVRKEIESHKVSSLQDARKGYSINAVEETKFELALSLLAQEVDPESDTQIEGMRLLEELIEECDSPLPRYELVRQYRFRRKYLTAIEVFKSVRDPDHARLLKNVTYCAYAVIGLYYSGEDSALCRDYAGSVMPQLEELMATDRHEARDVVDLCYLRAICGWGIQDCSEPLAALKPSETSSWTEIGNLASKAAQGDLADALLLGLEDPVIWSRIGSFYLEFRKDAKAAVEFYDRAIRIAPLSPVFYFNKAEALAYGLGDYQSASAVLEFSIRLKKNSYAWYRANHERLTKLREIVARTAS